jgi:hypothetical protein
MAGSTEAFFDSVKSFAAETDMEVVIACVGLTLCLQATVWKRYGWWHEALLWVPVGLSMLLTPVFSTTMEVQWGGQFYWKQVLYNGLSAAVLWRVGIPYLRQQFPALNPEEKPPNAPH